MPLSEPLDLVIFNGWGFEKGLWKMVESHLSDYQVKVINLHEAQTCNIPKARIGLGWSFGAQLGLSIVAKNQSHFKRFIALNHNPCFIKKNNWPGIDPEIFNQFKNLLTTKPRHLSKRFIKLCQWPDTKNNTVVDLQKNYINTEKNNTTLLNQLQAYSTDIRDTLKKIKIPLEYWLSEKDKLVPIEIMDGLKQLNQAIKINMRSGSHVDYINNSQHLAEKIKKVLHD